MDSRWAKFLSLKEEREAASQANLEATKREDGELQMNPRTRARLERKKAEAERFLAHQNAQVLGVDIERFQNRQYTIEEVEAWRRLQEERRTRKDPGFTDYNQLAFRKYEKKISALKPLAPGVGGKEAVAQLAQEMREDEAARAKFSKRRKFDETEDVTYINLRNYRFNKKLSRAYDKYTEELKDNLERGTAL